MIALNGLSQKDSVKPISLYTTTPTTQPGWESIFKEILDHFPDTQALKIALQQVLKICPDFFKIMQGLDIEEDKERIVFLCKTWIEGFWTGGIDQQKLGTEAWEVYQVLLALLYKFVPQKIEEQNSCHTIDTIFQGDWVQKDPLRLGFGWHGVISLVQKGTFYDLLQKRKDEISLQKEHWRAHIALEKSPFYQEVENTLKNGRLEPNAMGAGSSYTLYNEEGVAKFVVKPVDEDIFCLNNFKGYASLFLGQLVRKGIDLYLSAQTTEAAASIASLAGLGDITPEAKMMVITHEGFHDLSDRLTLEQLASLEKKVGPATKEKLVSVQRFESNSCHLFDVLNDLQHEGYSPQEIGEMFDPEDFSLANILVWLTYDTDAHFANLLAYVKNIDEKGRKIYGIRKIDNGLSLPTQNIGLNNSLVYLSLAHKPLTEKAKNILQHIDTVTICDMLKTLELDATIPAFEQRVARLQEIIQNSPQLTVKEINHQMKCLSTSEATFTNSRNVNYDLIY